MKNNNTYVFSQIFWTKQSEEVQCHGRETNPPDSTSKVVFITHFHTHTHTHTLKGVHEVTIVYSVSLRNNSGR